MAEGNRNFIDQVYVIDETSSNKEQVIDIGAKAENVYFDDNVTLPNKLAEIANNSALTSKSQINITTDKVTSIVLNDSSDCNIVNLICDKKDNNNQIAFYRKNLFDFSVCNINTNDLATVNSFDRDNCTINFTTNGTGINSGIYFRHIDLNSVNKGYGIDYTKLNGKPVALSFDAQSDIECELNVQFTKTSYTSVNISSTKQRFYVTEVVDMSKLNKAICFYLNSVEATATISNIQIEVNNIATDYEDCDYQKVALTDTDINSLHTYYPNTTVISDSDFILTYIADTKNYIDNNLDTKENASNKKQTIDESSVFYPSNIAVKNYVANELIEPNSEIESLKSGKLDKADLSAAILSDTPSDTTTFSSNKVNALLKEKIDTVNTNIGDFNEAEVDGENIIEMINNAGNNGGGLSQSAKDALINCFNHVAWIDENGASYVQTLQNALNASTTAKVVSISAVYSGGSVPSGSSLSALKENLVVTATYDDGTEVAVTGYTLSGSIAEGENTITVTYRKVTTTFTVTGLASYTITYNLTNVTSSSNISAVVSGGYYSTTLSYDDVAYVLQGITVTMSGVDITSDVYGDGTIIITEVTGDIVITAAAEEPVYIDMKTNASSDTIKIFSDDGSSVITTQNYKDCGACSLKRTETDANITVILTNNTENDVSGKAYVGAIEAVSVSKNNYIPVYYGKVGTSITIRAGESVRFDYTLPAGYYLYVLSYSTDIEVSAIGIMDIHEPVAEYPVVSTSVENILCYSDGTTDTQIHSAYYRAVTYTSEVFAEDTTLRITIPEGIHFGNPVYFGCIEEGAVNKLFYATSYIGGGVPKGALLVFEYTVKAGYCFAAGYVNGSIYVEKM